MSEHDDTTGGAVSGGEDDKVTELHRPIEFTIDGRRESTTVRRQLAADLLRLVGLDPARYDLGRLHGHQPKPTRFADEDVVTIHQGDRFVSARSASALSQRDCSAR